jgi:hypothetical protein
MRGWDPEEGTEGIGRNRVEAKALIRRRVGDSAEGIRCIAQLPRRGRDERVRQRGVGVVRHSVAKEEKTRRRIVRTPTPSGRETGNCSVGRSQGAIPTGGLK